MLKAADSDWHLAALLPGGLHSSSVADSRRSSAARSALCVLPAAVVGAAAFVLVFVAVSAVPAASQPGDSAPHSRAVLAQTTA
jgi:hypothetical protein